MSQPFDSLCIGSDDPLCLQLRDEHSRRYERIKAWRVAQSNPHFSEVSPLWRREFEKKAHPQFYRCES